MKLNQIFAVIILLVPIVCFGQGDEDAAKQIPQPPSEVVPEGLNVTAMLCADCMDGAKFDVVTHKGIYTDWSPLQQKYLKVLRSQVLNQDVWHQAQSKAHFDNCDFSGGTQYIRELMSEVDKWAKQAAASKNRKDEESEEREITKAYESIGMLLHGVQDFYAHSNYVEILVEKVKKKEITSGYLTTETIPLWYDRADNDIKELQKLGLVSGVVWWGLPQQCASGTLSHRDLAKDSNKGRGAQQIPELSNQTLHKLALKLAGTASIEFIQFAWEKWPVLKLGKSKDSFPLEVFVDRRKHE